ncbi:MAG TPA: hypothetical protein GYA04_01970 [Acholeplasma sp.]|nr:hypothetical protein [Acholeplasma sp.]
MGFLNSCRRNIYNITQQHKWIEERKVLAGTDKLTLSNTVDTGDVLLIIDKKYGIWNEGVNWTIDGQVITFLQLDEDLDFIIINLG